MHPNRRQLLAMSATLLAGIGTAQESRPTVPLGVLLYSYGIRSRVEKERRLSEPSNFLDFCANNGAAGVQIPLGTRAEADARAIRRQGEKLGLWLEGIVSPPKEEKADHERFAAELATARECGAGLVRVVLLGGRRYEVFDKPEDYAAFAQRAAQMLQRAEPIARRTGVKLAIENHKDFRTDEMLDLLKRPASEWLGICVDTGNNLALLEDPLRVIEALAPLALTVHLKDVAVEDATDGFRMAEVPLGQGMFELRAMVTTLRAGNPRIRFNLEMITRDPLPIPCLSDRYWATLEKVPGRDLARTLALVRRSAVKQPLPRPTLQPLNEQVALEDRHVRTSFEFARARRLLAD